MVAPGFRFSPTDEEIINHFLIPKANGLPLPHGAIVDCDLYNDDKAIKHLRGATSSPDNHNNNTFYCFTRLKKKNPTDSRYGRVTVSGTWKETQKEHKIFDHRDRRQVIGTKRAFKFLPKKGFPSSEERLLMDEFRLLLHTGLESDLAVCKIKRQDLKSKHRACDQECDRIISPVEPESPLISEIVPPAKTHAAEQEWRDEDFLAMMDGDFLAPLVEPEFQTTSEFLAEAETEAAEQEWSLEELLTMIEC